jgi:signal transduction histidine kinase
LHVSDSSAPARRRLRLRTVLLLINLVILALPLGGVAWLRLYESALIRQTESELIAQGAFISATYQSIFARVTVAGAGSKKSRHEPPFDYLGYGSAVTTPDKPLPVEGPWRPRLAELDLATDPILGKPPEPEATDVAPDPIAATVGRELAPILRNAQLVTLAGIRVVDFRGAIVASTSEDYGLSLTNHEEVQRALTGESVSMLRWRASDAPPPPLDSVSRGTRIRVFVAVPIIRHDRVLGAALLVRTPANIKQAIYGKRRPLLYGALILLAVVLVLSVLTSLTISRPVQDLIAQAKRAARGEKGAVIPLKHAGTREIAELSETVATMARTLEERATYIRDFAAHVSHEFKTPLTAIQGAVELLRDHAESMSAEERTRFLNILSSDARRLEELVRKLLELARADVMRVGDDHADVGAVLQAVAARYRELGLDVDLAAGAPRALVAMAPETLDSILSNLLDNARQHAGPGVKVTVLCEIDAEAQPPQMRITVSDNGSGISAANAAKIFEPFFTTARKTGNTGLGLPIIQSLLTAHRGAIELVPTDRGAIFRIRLPLVVATA